MYLFVDILYESMNAGRAPPEAAAEAAAAEAAPLPPELEFALVLVVRHLAVKTNHGPTDRFRT
jgi:hypothetical protein